MVVHDQGANAPAHDGTKVEPGIGCMIASHGSLAIAVRSPHESRVPSPAWALVSIGETESAGCKTHLASRDWTSWRAEAMLRVISFEASQKAWMSALPVAEDWAIAGTNELVK